MSAITTKAPEGAKIAALFGADEIIDNAMKKAALFANHGAAAVDMESHGAARAAAHAGAPFLAIRAIADPADRALPAAALKAVAPDGSTRVLTTLGAAMRDPRQFPDLMKLGRDSAAATKTLRRSLGQLFASLFLTSSAGRAFERSISGAIGPSVLILNIFGMRNILSGFFTASMAAVGS